MAAAPRGREAVQHWKDRNASPERTVVWTEPKSRSSTNRKVPVVYYLSRNGHLEHPHFMEVPISSPDGLYLKDVINRLNLLRGNGIATMYSWSSKRSYKNGFVWHDLTDDDLIHPAHGHEYVLKGSELLAAPAAAPPETPKPTNNEPDLPLRRKSPSRWKSLDLNEYKVYKNELISSDSSSAAADASTQTDDRLRRRATKNTEEENAERDEIEISPPPSSSSPETLETLISADRRLIRTEGPPTISYPGRIRASAVLMQLISCGSLSVNDPPEVSAMRAQYRRREMVGTGSETPMVFPAVRPEDRDCFSGSLIETKKEAAAGSGGEGGEFAGLKRSSSYNADRGSKLELEKEEDGVRARCIPRKPKTVARKEGNAPVSRSTHGSKRISDEQIQSLQI